MLMKLCLFILIKFLFYFKSLLIFIIISNIWMFLLKLSIFKIMLLYLFKMFLFLFNLSLFGIIIFNFIFFFLNCGILHTIHSIIHYSLHLNQWKLVQMLDVNSASEKHAYTQHMLSLHFRMQDFINILVIFIIFIYYKVFIINFKIDFKIYQFNVYYKHYLFNIYLFIIYN